MKATIVCTALLMIFQLVPASAEDSPYLYAAGESVTPHEPDDAVLPVEPPAGEEPAPKPNLRPPGFKTYMEDTTIWYGAQWAARLWWVRDKNLKIFDGGFHTFWSNLTSEPLWDDEDDFVVNWVLHPFFGMLSYQFYRARGHSVWASALGSVIQSTLFEYGIEGWAVRPSGLDLIVTPALGVPLGWTMEQFSEWLIQQDSKVARVAAYVTNPTRVFVKDTQFGLINPVTGAFQYRGQFTISTTKGKALELGYPKFFEPPLPLGRVGIDLELITLEKALGGEFILYPMRLEFPSESNYWGVYTDIPYGGTNNVTDGDTDIRDGYEFGNLMVGVKSLLAKSKDFALGAGLEVYFPTSFTDDQDRLAQIIKYRRDFQMYLYKATTVSPYVTAGAWRGPFSVQGALGSDFIFNAEEFAGQDFEFRINYHAAAGLNVPMTGSPILYCEFDGYSITTYDGAGGGTDLFLTPGIRFGKKYSPGFSAQLPVYGPTKDIADADFVFDFQLRV
ncbi:MAG TPA: DUF3943 domain-containing protein [Thermodesulfobacteriota bacterium]|nr:DUF3943 domain-containing protein [Thermodesulfobacteriota bacterium]